MIRFFVLFACFLACFTAFAAERQSETSKDDWILLSKDFSAFREPTNSWTMAAGARLNEKNKKALVVESGRNALVNGNQWYKSPNLITKQEWGDVEVALEFMIPQGSNSGVKLQGLYEIQIRDTSKAAKLTGNDCGGIYPKAELAPRYHLLDEGVAPRVNAAKAPGEWQTLSILFRAPKFNAKGGKTANARFERVTLNGRLIHENVELSHPTGSAWRDKEQAVGPLHLQGDHGPVIFRNVRVRAPAKSAGEK